MPSSEEHAAKPPTGPEADLLRMQEAAFGLAFKELMQRRIAGSARLGEMGPTDPALASELERLIEADDVDPVLAQYVRHVLRLGFGSAFDSMDPPS